jgi:hypothetical protein
VGNGLAEVGLLAVLTIIVLPCCLFTLLALLDRFERNLDPGAQTPPQLVKPATATAILAEAQDPAHDDDDAVSADVVSLPIPIAVAEAPAAATG